MDEPTIEYDAAGPFVRIPLTLGQFAKVSPEDYERVAPFKWCASRTKHAFYVRGGSRGMMMHRFLLGAKDGELVDHINHDPRDNRRSNIRICNHTQNHGNRTKKPGTSSRFRGVSWNPKRKNWLAQIRRNNRCVNLGRYRQEEDAARAYDRAARDYFGEFANLNFPEEPTP